MRAMDFGSEGWRMRPRDRRRDQQQGLERSVTRTGKIDNKDWRVILSNFLSREEREEIKSDKERRNEIESENDRERRRRERDICGRGERKT